NDTVLLAWSYSRPFPFCGSVKEIEISEVLVDVVAFGWRLHAKLIHHGCRVAPYLSLGSNPEIDVVQFFLIKFLLCRVVPLVNLELCRTVLRQIGTFADKDRLWILLSVVLSYPWKHDGILDR